MNEVRLLGSNVAKAFRGLILSVKNQERIVSCPELPIEIPGITFGDALDAGDALGTPVPLVVPKRGILYSSTLWDMDDDGFQIDLEVFKETIAAVAWDAAYAPTDAEMMNFVTELNFFAFDDHGTSQTSQIRNIGLAYTAPLGKFWIQGVARGASNIAAGNSPRFQLQIIPFDPDWS